MIQATALISHHGGEEFMKDLEGAILSIQQRGLSIEIQYSTENSSSGVIFTALLIGRKDDKK